MRFNICKKKNQPIIKNVQQLVYKQGSGKMFES